jgi:hypothetical protein
MPELAQRNMKPAQPCEQIDESQIKPPAIMSPALRFDTPDGGNGSELQVSSSVFRVVEDTR